MNVARPDADSAGPITAPSGTHGVTKIESCVGVSIDAFASDDASHDAKYWMEPVSQSSVLTVPGNWGNGNGGRGNGAVCRGFRGGNPEYPPTTTTPTCLPFLSLPMEKRHGKKKRHELQRHDASPTMRQRIYPSTDSSEPRKTRQPKAIQKPQCPPPAMESIPLEMNLILFHSCSVLSSARLHMLLLKKGIAATNQRASRQ